MPFKQQPSKRRLFSNNAFEYQTSLLSLFQTFETTQYTEKGTQGKMKMPGSQEDATNHGENILKRGVRQKKKSPIPYLLELQQRTGTIKGDIRQPRQRHKLRIRVNITKYLRRLQGSAGVRLF